MKLLQAFTIIKPIKYTWLACLFIALTASQCKKDNDPIGQLPPETQSGANTFGCLINGKVWVPSGSDGYSGINIKASYMQLYPTPVGYSFLLSAHDYNGKPSSFFVLGADSVKLTQDIKIKLSAGKAPGASGRYYISQASGQNYYSKDTLSGEIHLTKFDEAGQIASGTFWFDAVNSLGDTIHVTEGRFDVRYTR